MSLVPMTPSASMPSNRTLSAWLQHRLEEVGKHHHGLVPLHGRLFAQWLHYAYPRECIFPHAAGTIDPQRPEDVIASGQFDEDDIAANETVLAQVIADAAPVRHRVPGSETLSSEESAMWSMHEEPVVWRPPNEPIGDWWFSTHPTKSGRMMAMFGAVLSLSIALVRSLQPALGNAQKGATE